MKYASVLEPTAAWPYDRGGQPERLPPKAPPLPWGKPRAFDDAQVLALTCHYRESKSLQKTADQFKCSRDTAYKVVTRQGAYEGVPE